MQHHIAGWASAMFGMLRTGLVMGKVPMPVCSATGTAIAQLRAFTSTSCQHFASASELDNTSLQGSMQEQQQPSSTHITSSSQVDEISAGDMSNATASGSSSSSNGGMAFGSRQVQQRRRGNELLQGIVQISHTTNNMFVALTDLQGNVKAIKTAGTAGFRNARKKQPVAAEKTAEALAQAAVKLGYGSVVVKMKGIGKYKQLAVQSLHAAGLRITELQDITPVAYNGCRLPSRRRI